MEGNKLKKKKMADINKIVKKCDVLVVGAGVSGLVSAYSLLKKDPSLNVIILEAKGKLWIGVFSYK